MLQSSVIFQKAIELGINLGSSAIQDILPIYKTALKDMERILDTSDNSMITKDEINILEKDLRQIIATLHDLRDNLNANLDKIISFSETGNELVENSFRAIRSIERVTDLGGSK